MLSVTYEDVCRAVPVVHRYLRPTPLYEWPGLSHWLGCRLLVKHENHQPVGAFKVRGGVYLVGRLSPQERDAGIWGVSTGNHGQSLAYASRLFGVRCTIVVPEGNNPDKNRAIRLLGAELIEQGRDFDEARGYVESLIAERGGRYVHSANEPDLIAGVGSMAWEVFEQEAEVDAVVVPIGLGSGIASTCIVSKARRPQTEVIGVQAEGAAAVVESWRQGRMVTYETMQTWAEGMATRMPAEMTLAVMRELLDDAIVVSDDELRAAAYQFLKQTHNLAEGAGAAALAAVARQRDRFHGKTVVTILSGGNLDLAELPRILETGRAGLG